MAELLTMQDLANGHLDIKALGEAANGDENTIVTTRTGNTYPSAERAINIMFKNGGLPAEPFETKAQMEIDGAELVDGDYAMVTDDTANNGLYVKTAGAWVKSEYDPVLAAKEYTNTQRDILLANNVVNVFRTKLSMEASTLPDSSHAVVVDDSQYIANNTFYKKIAGQWVTLTNNPTEYTLNQVTNTGFGRLLATTASNINYNTSSRELVLSNTIYVATGVATYKLETPLTVSIPSNGLLRLEYNTSTGALRVRPYSSVRDLYWLFVAVIEVSATSFTTKDIVNYTVNGVNPNSTSKVKNSASGKLLGINSESINFDFTAKTIAIKTASRVIYNGTTYRVDSDVSVDMVYDGGWGWYCLLFNVDTKTFRTLRNTRNTNANEVIVAYYDSDLVAVDEVPYYSINGKPQNMATTFERTEFMMPYGNVSADYVPTSEAEPLKPLLDLHDGNLISFYGLYDQLVTDHPDYVTMTILGTDIDGNEIRQYRFNTPDIPTFESKTKRPKMILTAGVHGGGEKHATLNLYNVMRMICEEWETNDSLAALRWGVDFVVVPVVVPYNFINGGRPNKNGVDIARNFEANWKLTASTSYTYGGTAPLSEIESQLVDGVMSEHSDALLFISHHGYETEGMDDFPNGAFVWSSNSTEFGMNLTNSLITTMTMQAKKRYPWIAASSQTWFGRNTFSGAFGGESAQAVLVYGIQGCTFEVAHNLPLEVGKPVLSAATTTLISSSLINFLLLNLRYAPQYYNSRIELID